MALPLAEATRATLGLLTRRQGPEDFPYSPPLAQGLGVAAALSLALEFALQVAVPASLVAAVVEMLVIYWLLGRWLRRTGLANRLPQTFGAFAACTLALNLLEFPVVAAVTPHLLASNAAFAQAESFEDMVRIQQTLPPPPVLPFLLLMGVIVWGALVKTRLLERALNTGFWHAAWRLTLLLLAAGVLGGLAAKPFSTRTDRAGAPSAKPVPTAPARPAAS